MLTCPKCKCQLSKIGNTYKCPNNHSYDISKEGYINLLLSKTSSGDDKEMVNARSLFLNKGYYEPLALNLVSIISKYVNIDDYILDGGCGTGYYDKVLKSRFNNIIGYDISKDAIKKAAKENKDILYFVSSSNDISISNNSIKCFLNIFTPSFEKEAYRVLKDDGIYIIVSPKDNHLIELKELIYDNPYLNKENEILFDNFYLVTKEEITFKKRILHEDIINLVKMTPYFYKTKKEDLLKIDNIDDLLLTLSFNIFIYKKRTN